MSKTNRMNELQQFYPDALKSMQNLMSMNPVAGAQVEQFWNTQAKLLEETEAYTQRWFERRHEATRSALDAARKSTSGDTVNSSESMQAIAEWQRQSVERMVEDAREWLDMATRCARHISEREAEAMGEGLKKTAKTVDKATTKTKSDPV